MASDDRTDMRTTDRRMAITAATVTALLLVGCGGNEAPLVTGREPAPAATADTTASRSTGPDPTADDAPEPEATPAPDATTTSTSPRSTPRPPTPAATPTATPAPSSTTADATAPPRARPTPSPSPTARPTPSPSEPTPSPSETPDQPPTRGEVVIDEDDSGREFAFRRDDQVVLRLHPRYGQWSEPRVEGTSVELVERQFIRDPGYREWEVRLVADGRSRVTSTSDPCPGADPPCGAPSRLFEVAITVT